MSTDQFDSRTPATSTLVQRICIWCGPIGGTLAAIGLWPLAGFLPPPSPADSAHAIVTRYTTNATGIRVGMILCAAGFTLIAAWGCVIAERTWRAENASPALTFIQIAMLGVSLFVGVLFALAATLGTFRAGNIDPSITLTLNDLTWFTFLIWAPFALWLAAIALAVLLNTAVAPPLPRWLGWLTLWVALLGVPAALIPFFKHGPFAYNGLLAWYVPAFAFFIWLPPMTYALLRGASDETRATANGYRRCA
jgi:hypothetical protein